MLKGNLLYDLQFPLDEHQFNIATDSDWHANYNAANLQATVTNLHDDVIDDRICLGDVLNLRANERTENEFSYWDKELLVLGNHDMIDTVTGWNWAVQLSDQEAYYRWFAPYTNSNGIDITPNNLFWSKEYPEKGMLLIGGYCMYNNENDMDRQYDFIEEKLAYATLNGLSVMIAYHWTFAGMNVIHCSFTNARALDTMNGHDSIDPYLPNLNTYETRLHNLVETYIDLGLDFVCWLNGHRHTDELLIKDRQVHILVGSTKVDSGNKVRRTEGTTGEALMNVVSYDKERKLISVKRYGADDRTYGGLRKFLIMDTEGNVKLDYAHECNVT